MVLVADEFGGKVSYVPPLETMAANSLTCYVVTVVYLGKCPELQCRGRLQVRIAQHILHEVDRKVRNNILCQVSVSLSAWVRQRNSCHPSFRENGVDLAIINALEAIVTCLRSEDQYCVSVPEEGLSMKSLGM